MEVLVPQTRESGSAVPVIESAYLAMRTAIEQRAIDTVGLIVGPLTTAADVFVVASGTSQAHVQGICDKIKHALSTLGETPLSVTGYEHGQWILIDYADLVVHLFYQPEREYYSLDKLWKKADRIPLDETLEREARKLRTGLY